MNRIGRDTKDNLTKIRINLEPRKEIESIWSNATGINLKIWKERDSSSLKTYKIAIKN